MRLLPLPAYFRVSTLTAAALVFLLAAPLLFFSQSELLTSDESLYISEAINIAKGKGLVYTTGEPINHRGPVYPAVLAAAFKLAGTSLQTAYWVNKAFAVFNALLLFVIGRRLFGTWAGLIAASFAAALFYLNRFSTTLYLDGVQSFFMLVSILVLFNALERPRPLIFAASGTLLGLGFLTKETSVLWLPLPVLLVLFFRNYQSRAHILGVVTFVAIFLATALCWYVWVYAATGGVFTVALNEEPVALAVGVAVAGGLAIMGLAVTLALARLRTTSWREVRRMGDRFFEFVGRHARRWGRGAKVIGVAFIGAWPVIFLYLIGWRTTWDLLVNYRNSVPDYFHDVVGANVEPFYPVLAAWAIVLIAATRGRRGEGMLVLATALFVPWMVHVAASLFEVRQMLPIVYLSYLALGTAGALLLRWTGDVLRERGFGLHALSYGGLAILAALAGVFLFDQERDFLRYNDTIHRTAITQSNWDNPLVARTAQWIQESIPPGEPIMSSRLYFSHLYFLTEARYPIHQVPTVSVRFDFGQVNPLRPYGSLFRWEHHLVNPPRDQDRWLYLRYAREKGYWVALSELDLLEELREREIEYLVITGTDAYFSNFTFLDYYMNQPGLTLIHSDSPRPFDQVYVFRVSRDELALVDMPTTMTSDTFFRFLERARQDEHYVDDAQLFRDLNPHGVRIVPRDNRASKAEEIIARAYAETSEATRDGP